MPITPFHFGPGALIKAAVPNHVSWTTFALANCLIDAEPIVLFLTTGDPAHPWLHTPPGALLVAVVSATLGKPLCEVWLRWWNRNLSSAQARWLGTSTMITARSAWLGALLGTSTHLTMDMFMHADVRPAWPLLDGNPMVGMIELDVLHWGSVACAALGLAGLLIRRKAALRQAETP